MPIAPPSGFKNNADYTARMHSWIFDQMRRGYTMDEIWQQAQQYPEAAFKKGGPLWNGVVYNAGVFPGADGLYIYDLGAKQKMLRQYSSPDGTKGPGQWQPMDPDEINRANEYYGVVNQEGLPLPDDPLAKLEYYFRSLWGWDSGAASGFQGKSNPFSRPFTGSNGQLLNGGQAWTGRPNTGTISSTVSATSRGVQGRFVQMQDGTWRLRSDLGPNFDLSDYVGQGGRYQDAMMYPVGNGTYSPTPPANSALGSSEYSGGVTGAEALSPGAESLLSSFSSMADLFKAEEQFNLSQAIQRRNERERMNATGISPNADVNALNDMRRAALGYRVTGSYTPVQGVNVAPTQVLNTVPGATWGGTATAVPGATWGGTATVPGATWGGTALPLPNQQTTSPVGFPPKDDVPEQQTFSGDATVDYRQRYFVDPRTGRVDPYRGPDGSPISYIKNPTPGVDYPEYVDPSTGHPATSSSTTTAVPMDRSTTQDTTDYRTRYFVDPRTGRVDPYHGPDGSPIDYIKNPTPGVDYPTTVDISTGFPTVTDPGTHPRGEHGGSTKAGEQVPGAGTGNSGGAPGPGAGTTTTGASTGQEVGSVSGWGSYNVAAAPLGNPTYELLGNSFNPDALQYEALYNPEISRISAASTAADAALRADPEIRRGGALAAARAQNRFNRVSNISQVWRQGAQDAIAGLEASANSNVYQTPIMLNGGSNYMTGRGQDIGLMAGREGNYWNYGISALTGQNASNNAFYQMLGQLGSAAITAYGNSKKKGP